MINKVEKSGYTVENLPFSLVLSYAEDSVEGDEPERIEGQYASADGGGTFCIQRQPGGMYFDVLHGGEPRKNPTEMLPWVVAESDWG